MSVSRYQVTWARCYLPRHLSDTCDIPPYESLKFLISDIFISAGRMLRSLTTGHNAYLRIHVSASSSIASFNSILPFAYVDVNQVVGVRNVDDGCYFLNDARDGWQMSHKYKPKHFCIKKKRAETTVPRCISAIHYQTISLVIQTSLCSIDGGTYFFVHQIKL